MKKLGDYALVVIGLIVLCICGILLYIDGLILVKNYATSMMLESVGIVLFSSPFVAGLLYGVWQIFKKQHP